VIVPGAHGLTVVNYGHNETKATSFVRTRTNQGASAAAQVQVGTRFSRGQQRTKQKGKKTYFHKTKPNRGESAAAWFQKCKEAFVLYNEDSDDEE